VLAALSVCSPKNKIVPSLSLWASFPVECKTIAWSSTRRAIKTDYNAEFHIGFFGTYILVNQARVIPGHTEGHGIVPIKGSDTIKMSLA
jgi:hypothetical protein